MVLLLGLSVCTNATASDPDVIEARIAAGIEYMIANPWPYPELGHAPNYALALLCRNQSGADVTNANAAISDYFATYSPGDAGTNGCPDALLAMYLRPEFYDLLTPTNRANIEQAAYYCAFDRSVIDPCAWSWNNASKSVWYMTGSENHDANYKSANLLATQLLHQAGPPYGPDALLGDGYTVDQHYHAWTAYWKEYFYQRAREGLDCEIAHPSSYGMSTVGSWYQVTDLTDDAQLKTIGEDYLDLYWAHVACDFEPRTGIRSSFASTRSYKFSWYQIGTIYWARDLLYAYDWTDVVTEASLLKVGFFAARYRPPEIVRAIGRDTNRGPYLAWARRFGRAGPWDSGVHYFEFDDGPAHNSYLLRGTYYTGDYTMSWIGHDPVRPYLASVTQSRIMGVACSADIDDRIVLLGSDPNNEYKMPTFYGVNGVGGTNCMVVGREPRATSWGTRIFVSNEALWDNRIENDEGWFFTYNSGGAYCAIRIAQGGYTVVPSYASNGYYLELDDIWAPIVIQMGQAEDYMDMFILFQNDVKNNTSFSYSGGKLSYTSLAGDTYEFWSNSTNIPHVNAAEIELNPVKTYDYPNLSMVHGESTATVTCAGYDDLVLTFPHYEYCGDWGYLGGDVNRDCNVNQNDVAHMAQNWLTSGIPVTPPTTPFSDDEYTVGLWHFDSSYSSSGTTRYPDDDSANPGRDREATESATTDPYINMVGDGKFAHAVSLDYPSSSEINMLGAGSWPVDAGTFRYQGWIRFADMHDGGDCLFHIYDQVWMYAFGGCDTIRFGVDPLNNGNNVWVYADLVDTNDWQYVEACYDGDTIVLATEKEVVKKPGMGPIVPNLRIIYLGSRKTKQQFGGQMDEIKLSTIPPTMDCANLGCPPGDVNGDCTVNLKDFAALSADWAKCTTPNKLGCVDLR